MANTTDEPRVVSKERLAEFDRRMTEASAAVMKAVNDFAAVYADVQREIHRTLAESPPAPAEAVCDGTPYGSGP